VTDRDHITVEYEKEGIKALVRVEYDDPDVQVEEAESGRQETREAITGSPWIELKGSDVGAKGSFTKFLNEHGRASTHLRVWCDQAVWEKFLKLLDLRQPLPPTVTWPMA
jgi:hypothetical protein